jgi:isocitrate/isopropylmalate dehydrogenase
VNAPAKRVAVVPGDDAAPEAMRATLHVLEHMRLPIDWVVLQAGESLDPELGDTCDTVLFGSSNGSTQGLAQLRYGWGTFANVRPVKHIPGVPSALSNPEGIDFIIVREALQDVYAGVEGKLDALVATGLPLTTGAERRGAHPRYPFTDSGDGVYAIKIFTRQVVELVARFSAALALRRKHEGHAGRGRRRNSCRR